MDRRWLEVVLWIIPVGLWLYVLLTRSNPWWMVAIVTGSIVFGFVVSLRRAMNQDRQAASGN